MDEALTTAPATEQVRALDAGEVASRELLDAFVDRIERLDGPINAVVTLDLDRARAAAAEADEVHADGRRLGPLHGLPLTIKDAIEVAGVRSTGGAVELTDHRPAEDAPVVTSLRAAGAVVFAKTNVPRWSGDVQTYNDIFGTTNNPWDTTRTTGGSSGGPAAAVACGFTGFEVGTDIGGSVRIPSHCCGTFGLKPTWGVVPQRGYLDAVGGGTTDVDINVFGPIARSAPDLDLALSVLAGPDPDRAAGWRLALPEPAPWTGRRVGVWIDEPAAPIASDVRTALRRAADQLADSGVVVEDAHPPVSFAEQVSLFERLLYAAVSTSADDDLAPVMAGSHLDWLAADRRRAAVRTIWATWFGQFDALLCPVFPVSAFPHDHTDMFSRTLDVDGVAAPYLGAISWAGLIGVLGLPSAVPPLAVAPGGLPVGAQLVVPWYRDRDAIALAGHLAGLDGGFRIPPLQ